MVRSTHHQRRQQVLVDGGADRRHQMRTGLSSEKLLGHPEQRTVGTVYGYVLSWPVPSAGLTAVYSGLTALRVGGSWTMATVAQGVASCASSWASPGLAMIVCNRETEQPAVLTQNEAHVRAWPGTAGVPPPHVPASLSSSPEAGHTPPDPSSVVSKPFLSLAALLAAASTTTPNVRVWLPPLASPFQARTDGHHPQPYLLRTL